MKKIILNLTDTDYVKLMFEAMVQQKDLGKILRARIFEKPFSEEVNEAFDDWMEKNVNEILKEK